MDAALRQEWLNRLRSGKYQQGRGRLRNTLDATPTYCCLGVLCDIFVERGVGRWFGNVFNEAEDEFGCQGSGHMFLAPAKLAGIENSLQDVLAIKNDRGDSFDMIADYIEAVL